MNVNYLFYTAYSGVRLTPLSNKNKKLVLDGRYIYDILYIGMKVCVFAVENRTRVNEQRRENNTNDSFV